jgi:DNA-binding CsgD family transcriptional regulator
MFTRLLLAVTLALTTLCGYSFNQSISDSLAQQVNTAENDIERLKELERAVRTLIHSGPNAFQTFRNKLDYSKLNTHNALVLDAYTARHYFSKGSTDSLLALPANGNPFIKFYQGNAHFYEGNTARTIQLNQEAAELFTYYSDTIYIASCHNNIGAAYWHLNELDSALSYFLKAKDYTYWHNEMLEINILAIANVLEDTALAQQQILKISEETEDESSPYFLVNLHSFYDAQERSELDSIQVFIQKKYALLGDVPEPLLPLFIKKEWKLDSLSDVLLERTGNSFYNQAFNALLTSNAIGSEAFTAEVLSALSEKTSDTNSAYIGRLMAKLSAKERAHFARVLDANKKALFIGLILLALAFIAFSVVQTISLRRAKESIRLAENNAALIQENTAMQQEVIQIRSTIEEVAKNSSDQVRKLRKAVEELDTANVHLELPNDLNVIAIHEEGMLRFKIKEIAEGLQSKQLDALGAHLNEKEALVLKLTLLDFRSKEIAVLLGVTPQHVNNLRTKIKSKIEDGTQQEYASVVAEISRELFQS